MKTRHRRSASLAVALATVVPVAACADSNDAGSVVPTTVAESPAATDDGPPPSDSTEAPLDSSTTTSLPPPAPPTTAADPDGSVVSAFAGAPWFLGRVPERATPADESLPPIRLGMINQEDTAVGSYPEIRAAVEAAIAWVNTELGGVDGHPIELDTCIVPFDADRSRTCALELVDAGVVAFVGGVNVLSEAAYEIVEANGLVSVGGIPANLVEQRSSNAFFFSGGDAGALAAFMAHEADQGAATVAIAYGAEVESFEVAARDYGAAVGRSLGMEVELIPFSLFTTDFAPVITEASELGAEAVMVLAATSACLPVLEAAAAEPDVSLYLTGACASAAEIGAASDAGIDVVWNAEGPVDGDVVEASMYQAVVDRYADEPAGGAGTVGFRGFMNLYALLLEAGAYVSPAELAALARASVGRPSFWGHPYSCDGRQVPGLPALCAPQQVLFTFDDDRGLRSVTGWIATDELFAAVEAPG